MSDIQMISSSCKKISPVPIWSWEGKRVLITGGTKGLGLGMVRQLEHLGAKIAVVARSLEGLENFKKSFPDVLNIRADVGNQEDIHKISGQFLGQVGGIDVLINNASSLGATPLRLFLDTECEDFLNVIGTNVLGPFRLIKAILPNMIFNGGGLIMNISSDAGVSAYSQWGAYGVSKAAVDHMSRIFQEEIGHKNIQFLSIDPGDMNTELHLKAIPDANIHELYDPNQVAVDMANFIERNFTKFDSVRYAASEWRRLI